MVPRTRRMMTNSEAVANWAKGATGSTIAAISTFQEQLDFWTRYSFVLIGGVLTILSIVKLLKNWNK